MLINLGSLEHSTVTVDIILNFETISRLESQVRRIHIVCIPSPEALYHSVLFGLAGDSYPSSHAHSVRCASTRGYVEKENGLLPRKAPWCLSP